MTATFDGPAADRSAETRDRIAQIIAEFQASLGELKCVMSQRLVRQGVSMSQLHVMWMLERHGELSMSRLAEMLDVSLSNATGLVDRMEERGMVDRVRIPDDRRAVHVRISDRGRQLLSDVDILRDDLTRRILGRLDDDQLERAARALSDIHDAVVAVVADEDPLACEALALHSHSH